MEKFEYSVFFPLLSEIELGSSGPNIDKNVAQYLFIAVLSSKIYASLKMTNIEILNKIVRLTVKNNNKMSYLQKYN